VRLVDRPVTISDFPQEPAGGERLELGGGLLARQLGCQRWRNARCEGCSLEQLAPGRRCGIKHPVEQVEVDLIGDGTALHIRSTSTAQQLAGEHQGRGVTAGQRRKRFAVRIPKPQPRRESNALLGLECKRQVVAQRKAPRGNRIEVGRRRRLVRDKDELQSFIGQRDESRQSFVPRRFADPVSVVEHDDEPLAGSRMERRSEPLGELPLARAILRQEMWKRRRPSDGRRQC
jgi:hypothetical protein